MGKFENAFFVVFALVVDGVVEAQWFEARKFFIGGRCPKGFNAKQTSDLHGGGSNTASGGVNQHPWTWLARVERAE